MLLFLFFIGSIALIIRTFSEGTTEQTVMVQRIAKGSRTAFNVIAVLFAIYCLLNEFRWI